MAIQRKAALLFLVSTPLRRKGFPLVWGSACLRSRLGFSGHLRTAPVGHPASAKWFPRSQSRNPLPATHTLHFICNSYHLVTLSGPLFTCLLLVSPSSPLPTKRWGEISFSKIPGKRVTERDGERGRQMERGIETVSDRGDSISHS